ncbi:hypothetical protein OAJ94_01450 [Deltaproteobacteria bacterium]|nr:hypothetical protein [Deltaproteobacteria bacterium]
MTEDTQSEIQPRDSNERMAKQYQREISRLRLSPSFRIGTHIVKAFERPWKLLFIWISLPVLLWKVAMERLGRREPVYDGLHLPPASETRNCIILFPTNGVGFGHFTRMLAVARSLRKADRNLEIVFFTTMPTLHILTEEGFPAYHVSGKSHFSDMEPKAWNSVCEELLLNVFAIHRPKAFVFDGAFPYRGMLNAIKNQDEMLKIWMKRGTLKSNASSIPVGSVQHFDTIITPSDGSSTKLEAVEGVEMMACDPIVLASKEELLPRHVLRSRLGIPDEAILVYVQLGAGRINDIESEIRMTIDTLMENQDVYVVIGESMIGERIEFNHSRVRILRDYPNSFYFNSFDFAIIAGGYNSIHEVVRFQLPSICYPNMNTGKDDQLMRARLIEEAGGIVVVKHRTKRAIKEAIVKMLDSEFRTKLGNDSSEINLEDGSTEVASWLVNQISM